MAAPLAPPLSRLLRAAGALLGTTREPDDVCMALSAVLRVLVPTSSRDKPLDSSFDEPPCSVEAAPVRRALQELLSEADGASEELSRLFVRAHYSQWAALLLGPVLREWISAFTLAQRSQLFDPFFLRAPPREAFEAIANALVFGADDDLDELGVVRHQRANCCANLISSMVSSRRLEHLFLQIETATDTAQAIITGVEDTDVLVSLLVSIPPRLANLYRGAPPKTLSSPAYFASLIEQLISALNASNLARHAAPSPLARFSANLLARLARLGELRTLLPILVAGPACLRDVLCQLPAGSIEPTLEASIRHAANHPSDLGLLRTLLGPLIRKSSTARHLLGERFLILRAFPERVVPPLLALLAEADNACAQSAVSVDEDPTSTSRAPSAEKGSTLLDAMERVAAVWSVGSHVIHAPLAQQRYLTAALLGGIERLSDKDAKKLIVPLLGGIQEHLQAPSEPIRRLGLQVAQRVALLIDPTKPLDFEASESDADDEAAGDSLAVDSQSRDLNSQSSGAVAQSEVAGVRLGRRKPRCQSEGRQAPSKGYDVRAAADGAFCDSDVEEADPDAEARLPGTALPTPPPPKSLQCSSSEAEVEGSAAVSLLSLELASMSTSQAHIEAEGCRGNDSDSNENERGSGDDSDWDVGSSDESLPAYDLTDDRSDLTGAQQPRHLRQLLAGLRAKQGEYMLLSASLRVAAELIRKSVDSPELSYLAPVLARTLLHLSDEYKLPQFGAHRRNALCGLPMVALAVRCPKQLATFLCEEFYGNTQSLEMRMEALQVIFAMANELQRPPSNGVDAKEHPKKVQPQNEEPAPGKTRRWGTSSRRVRPKAAPSLLGEVAPYFFYPLMRRYDDPGINFRLLGEDCFLLEVLLQTLAALLRGAAAYPCARSMVRSLYDFAWSLRIHPEAVVRRGVLIALSSIGEALIPFVLMQELNQVIPDLQAWLVSSAHDDADVGCQQLALVCHSIFGKKVRAELQMELSDTKLELRGAMPGGIRF